MKKLTLLVLFVALVPAVVSAGTPQYYGSQLFWDPELEGVWLGAIFSPPSSPTPLWRVVHDILGGDIMGTIRICCEMVELGFLPSFYYLLRPLPPEQIREVMAEYWAWCVLRM